MFAGLVAILAFGGCTKHDSYQEPERHAREILEAYIAATGVPALQIAVGAGGRIVWSEAFGTADLASDIPATTDSRFRIASISKLLTGTLAAKLADAGTLDLDRPIGEYVPDLPPEWHDITADMLLHHTSGIPHYSDAQDALDTTYYATTRDALKRFEDRPLVHPPGTEETYSSYAYTVLALCVEQVTGRPFLDVMRAEILDPLGMTRTGPDVRSTPPPGLTAFYDLAEDGTVRKAPDVDLSGRWAGSGYLSTADDLVRFGMAHTKPGVFSAGTLAMVAERDTLPDGELTKEGFGWGPRTDWDGRAMLWGDGSTPGSRCGLLVYPDDGLVIAILTNLRGLALERGEFQTLARLFLAAGEGVALLPPPAGSSGDWRGSLKLGKASIAVDLAIESPASDGRGKVSFAGWRSLSIADMFGLDGRTWTVPLDNQGFFPITFTLEGDSMAVAAPRTGWSFVLARARGEEAGGR
jgi:serine beta-lactamase-like protein LACTB